MKFSTGTLPQPEAGAAFEPSDFAEVLQNVPSSCVLIGGQAVVWWAHRYGIQPKGAKYPDLLSKDIDFWGSLSDLFHFARQLNKTPVLPGRYEMTVLAGAIEISIQGKKTALEILHSVPGLDSVNPELVAIPEKTGQKGDKSIMVLSPVSLVLAKLHALSRFCQDDRQDLLHLRLSLAACERFIPEVMQQNTRFALWNCNRLIEASQHHPNQRLEHKHKFKILSSIPIDQLKTIAQGDGLTTKDRERLSNFLALRWPRVTASQISENQAPTEMT